MFTCARHRTDMVSNTCDVDGGDSGDDDDGDDDDDSGDDDDGDFDDGDLIRSVSISECKNVKT